MTTNPGILTSSIIFIFWDYNTPEWLLYLTMIPSVSFRDLLRHPRWSLTECLVQGLGFSCVLTTTLVALLSSVPREQISVATGGALRPLYLTVSTSSLR